MRVLIIGAAGMIGRLLAERLARDGAIDGRRIGALDLVDVVEPAAPALAGGRVEVRAADLALAETADAMVATRPDLVVHLAAIVSGEAEADIERGYRVNLDGTRMLFDAIRRIHDAEGWTPRVLFASTNAVFGGDMPTMIPDDFALTPTTSYGTQKAMCELNLADYTRRGFFEGVGIRLPTICVRPGKPNRAASSFFSGIIREPLAGQEAILPVSEEVRHWMASPRSAVQFFVHAATLDMARLGARPNLTMPGLSVTVAEQIEALRRVAGDEPVSLIRRERDPFIERIVNGWAQGFEATRARALGFTAETRFDEIIRVYLDDHAPGR